MSTIRSASRPRSNMIPGDVNRPYHRNLLSGLYRSIAVCRSFHSSVASRGHAGASWSMSIGLLHVEQVALTGAVPTPATATIGSSTRDSGRAGPAFHEVHRGLTPPRLGDERLE